MSSGRGGRLNGRVALVTGGAQGIGEAVVRRFVAEDARVVVADRASVAGERLASELGERATSVQLEVQSVDSWNAAVSHAELTFGSPTVLVHNAGVMVPGTAENPEADALELAFGVNLLGPALGTAACVPGMRAGGGGSVVVVSSIAALTGAFNFLPYAMSKSAALTYVRCAARELGAYGIRVNALVPGGIDTPMSSENFQGRDLGSWFGSMPIPRIGRPDEVADGVLYLASDESSFVTGTSLVVDGGQVHGPVARPTPAADLAR